MSSNAAEQRIKNTRVCKPKSRWLRDLPAAMAAHVHPTLKALADSRRHVRRRIPLKRSLLAATIKRRTFNYNPLPRVFPFYCHKCCMSTRHYRTIAQHHCPSKKERYQSYDFENEQRIAVMGFRSRARDALAVLERVPCPQSINVHSIESTTHQQAEAVAPNGIRVPSLIDLCTQLLAPEQFTADAPTELFYRIDRRAKPLHKIRGTRGVGRLCTGCDGLFASFALYDAHLDETSGCGRSPPDPLPVQVGADCTVPLSAQWGVRRARPVQPDPPSNPCTLCGETQFVDMPDFHSHILACARSGMST